MGGLILVHDDRLYRLGQDSRRSYGDGLLLFSIDKLSRSDYLESDAGSLRFAKHRGPHTLNLRRSQLLFDHYDNRFSIFAGVRRLKQRRFG